MDEMRQSATTAPPPAGPYEPHPVLRWLYQRFFAHIEVDERWSSAVRDAAQRGVVVHVMRSISFLDFLCLDFLVKRVGLPAVRFVNDLGLWILEPFGKGGRRLRLRRQIPEDKALASTILEHHSALLFLRRPPRIGRPRRRGEELEIDLIRVLVETQRTLSRSILLVPQTFVWSQLPSRPRRGLVDLLFGPREWPGRIRVFLQFLLNYRNAKLRSGEPFDLARFVRDNSELDDERIADKVRYALLRRIERERTLVLGPTAKSPGRIRDELLRSPRLRKHIEAEARASGKAIPKVERLARRELRRLCAAQDQTILSLTGRSLDWVWERIYDGLVVDKEGIERLRAAGREGTLLLLPSHKSHIDYLVLSYVLHQHSIKAPHIAAGDNLSFFPLGPFLRRCGAFYIRRSFRGKKLYAALVDAYLRKLLAEGFSVEFFVEGGRSRSGKLQPPKLGLLSMAVDSALALKGHPIMICPISIGYERVIEERSYVRELAGGEKEKENIGDLLKTPRILRSKYGRLYVQFGEIFPFESVLREVGTDAACGTRELSPPARRQLVQLIGHRVVSEIARVTVVTPSALIATSLLNYRRRGVTRSEILATVTILVAALRKKGARLAAALTRDEHHIREDAADEALSLFVDGKLVNVQTVEGESIYVAPDERRIALEYYKNNCLHFFAPNALIAAALLSKGDGSVSLHTLTERVRQLAELFKHERLLRTNITVDELLTATLAEMREAGEIEHLADHIRPTEEVGAARMALYRGMMRSHFESYRLAVVGAKLLNDTPMSKSAWIKRTLAIGQRMYLAGEIETREALSREKIDGAILAMRDHRIMRVREETLQIHPELQAGELDELERTLGGFAQ